MELKTDTRHILGIVFGLIIILLDIFLFLDNRWFKPIIAIAFLIATIQYWVDFFNENKRQKEIETKFLEFVRALVETVKSGIPLPKAILRISHNDFGALSPHVKKLAHQIEWGFPLHESLNVFAYDTKNKVIKKTISIVIEAERSGGNIDDILQAVATSIVQIKKIKEERRANTYSQTVQGYVVFFVFIGIMLVLQVYLLPQLATISGTLSGGLTGQIEPELLTGEPKPTQMNLDIIFMSLVLIQGFFAGLMIGKFAEGELKMGLKHSLILMVIGYLIITTIRGV